MPADREKHVAVQARVRVHAPCRAGIPAVIIAFRTTQVSPHGSGGWTCRRGEASNGGGRHPGGREQEGGEGAHQRPEDPGDA